MTATPNVADPIADQEQTAPAPAAIAVSRTLNVRIPANRVHKWITRGVRGVRLSTTLIGGRHYTTPAKVREFQAAIENARAAG